MTSKKISNDMKDAFPVFMFDYEGRLTNSNLTALPLLGNWKCRKGAKIPSGIFAAYPEMKYALNDACPTECKVQFGEYFLWFDVIPYPEAGFIGMYGFHIEAAYPEKSAVPMHQHPAKAA